MLGNLLVNFGLIFGVYMKTFSANTALLCIVIYASAERIASAIERRN